MDPFVIRPATSAEAAAMRDIYNHYVLHETCTWQVEPETLDDRQRWLAGHGERFPVTVAVAGHQVLAWASLSPYNARHGYRFTAEDSVYVHPERRGAGLGRAMLADLIARAEQIGHRSIIAGISSDGLASVALHERFGFQPCARLREAGFKFGRWLDLLYLQRML
jgi:phosphinothricin acetyltransferase